jgi:hypothetical protein
MKTRLAASDRKHHATLYKQTKTRTPIGDQLTEQAIGTPKGSFKKQRGGIINAETLEISTEKASFWCDYRPRYVGTTIIELDGVKYDVVDETNVGLANHSLLFDLEKRHEN